MVTAPFKFYGGSKDIINLLNILKNSIINDRGNF